MKHISDGKDAHDDLSYRHGNKTAQSDSDLTLRTSIKAGR